MLFVSFAAAPDISIESRTLSPVSPEQEGVNLIFNQRIVAEGTIVLAQCPPPCSSSRPLAKTGGRRVEILFVNTAAMRLLGG